MFKNYLKIAFRNIKNHKGYSFINIAGLAIGMACCILMVVYISFELSFDRYHENADRIYRLCRHANIGGTDIISGGSNATAAAALRDSFPEVVNAVRFGSTNQPVVKYQDKQFFESRLFYADDTVFDIFSWQMIKGNPGTALKAPYSIVLTEDIAKKYFGDKEALGKILKFNNKENYTVTGVIKNIPVNSHFLFNGLLSFKTLYARGKTVSHLLTDWLSYNYFTYVLLQKGVNYRDLEKKFPAFLEKHAGDQIRAKSSTLEYFLHPLKKMHLYNIGGQRGDGPILYIYIFTAIAVFVLLIACVNFMNLSTARASNRVLEVGIRKVVGANRRKLIWQFLMDALVFSSLSIVLALLLVEITLPLMGSLVGRPLNLNINEIPWFIPGILGMVLFTGLLAGSYPAFFLTAFQPIKVLKGDLRSGASNSRLRGILVVAQFAICIILIIAIELIISQLNYMKTRDPGFDKEHVVVLPMMDDQVRKKLPMIKKELESYHGVLHVSAASTLPGRGSQTNDKIPEGFTQATVQLMDDINIDPDFIPTMGMKIIEGRNFSKTFGTDERNAVIINETAAQQYGWKEPLGKIIKSIAGRNPDGSINWVAKKVIGVVKDVHIAPITNVILPLYIGNTPEHRYNPYRVLAVRIKAGDIAGTMDFLKRKWEAMVPHMPFDSFFLDASFNRQFRDIERSMDILSYFTFLAIFIACLGLLGLASFTAEKRTKEIGIRKVLGATVSNITLLLTKEFTKLLLLANVIAWPIAYLIMNNWMRNFPYRTSIGVQAFFLAGAMALVIALATVSYQSIKAAVTRPIDALRYE
ncbi:MAG: ABC transporter permease [Candidatus Aminicenantes bacterium]|jgi:ABC-type antimicrobial peptide transport system permease subunit